MIQRACQSVDAPQVRWGGIEKGGMPSTFDVGRLRGRAFSLGLPHKMIDDLTILLPGYDPGHEVKGLPVANTSLSKSRRVGGKPISNGSITRESCSKQREAS